MVVASSAARRRFGILTLGALLGALGACAAAPGELAPREPPAKRWRDLNHDGSLTPYEDPGLSVDERTEDLLGRMTVEEKVGTMLHGTLPAAAPVAGGPSQGYDLAAAEKLIRAGGVTSLVTRLSLPPEQLAEANNAVQKIAAESRLGIPLTISTDPRHHFEAMLGTSVEGAGFTQWPETLGFAALRDPALVRRFGAVAAGEYRAVGIQMALSPQADLATEPRWTRASATFGSDPATVSSLAKAYVEGFQGGTQGVRSSGVATVVKHWVGYGAQPEGFDAHNSYGRFARLDDRSFQQHVAAFRGALSANAAGVMPTYAILQGVRLDGRPLEPVAAGFNKQLIKGLLQDRLGYGGLILSDWAITEDCGAACLAPTESTPQRPAQIGMPWGVEALSREERFAKAVAAGIDQFGGVNDPAALLADVRSGAIAEVRIDRSVRKVLRLKFELGLFENPFVDAAAAARVVGVAQAEADAAQRRALVILENSRQLLPVDSNRKRVWLHGIAPAAAVMLGLSVVDSPEAADFAIVRMSTPFERLHPYHFFGSRHHEGRLDFRAGDAAFDVLSRVAKTVPTIAVVDLDRPAILTNVRDAAAGLIVAFGASDAAVLDVITGRARAQGRLPFELPSSMEAVAAQHPGRPDDSTNALYPRGAGLSIVPVS
jgi:beta-glucosidase